jgi:flavin-dependent dehydrogenase
MTDRWDLIVAGAGPSGCALAAKVAGSGGKVLLLERESEPAAGRDWVVDVERSTFAAARVPPPEEEDLFAEPDRTVLVTSDRRHSIELMDPPLVPVRNSRYVKRLSRWAVSEGAVLRTSCVASEPIIRDGAAVGLMASVGGGEPEPFYGSIIADCTGISGKLRRKTPASWLLDPAVSPSDIVLARRETRRIDPVEVRKAIEPGLMMDRVRIDRSGAQGVYSIETCFLDLDAGFVDILVGVKPGSGPGADERFAAILRERPYIGEKVFGDGGPIPIRRGLDTLVADGLLVLGDCACQTIPAHGSGTASALLAADLASASILRALEVGRSDRQALWGYNYAFQAGRGAVLAYYDVVRRHTEHLTVPQFDALIAAGVLSPREVYSGLIPEVPHMGPAEILSKLSRGRRTLGLLAGFAKAGISAERTMKHFADYPSFYRPGAVEEWAKGMPRAD